MALQDQFSLLIEANTTEGQLHKGAGGKPVKTLQRILFQMGFGEELRWKDFGADGDYGSATTAAVQAFARKNGLRAEGDKVSPEIARQILQRFLLLPVLERLRKALHRKTFEQAFSLRGEAGRTLMPLLIMLGFSGDSEADALQAFCEKHGLNFEEKKLTEPIAQRLFDECAKHYGSKLSLLLLFEPVEQGLDITGREHTDSKGNRVTSYTVRSAGREVQFKGFWPLGGFFQFGDLEPREFVEKHWDTFFGDTDFTESSRKIIAAVSQNEGKLEAINTWDGAFLSFGMFQWTLGTGSADGELPVLLRRLREQQPEAFDRYFGRFGLDIDDANTGTTYGYITLQGERIKQPAQKEAFRSPEWGFRFWEAGLDPRVQAVEVEHAISRLNNFYWKTKNGLNGHSLSQLITSEFGVALLLDQNVNRPNDVYTVTADALKALSLGDPASWSDQEELKLIDKYLKLREDTPMTHPKIRAERIRRMIGEGPGLLSSRRGSFQFSQSAFRSLTPGSSFVPPPPGYREEEYPDIREKEQPEETPAE